MSEEIKELRQEMNDRFDKVEKDISDMKTDILDVKSENLQIRGMLQVVLDKLNGIESNIDWLVKKQEDTDHELTASKAQYDRLEAKLR